MIRENLRINGKDYTFLVQYKEDEALRASFNLLTQRIYNFDFEKWYQRGYWTDNCLLYSLANEDKIISHVTVNLIDFIVLGKKIKTVQLGTVMTDIDYRNQGLNRVLMEKVLKEWKDKCDMIYLFANDSVLDFYPKFGFVSVDEYQAVCKVEKTKEKYIFRKLNIDNADDRDLLYHFAQNAVSLAKVSMCNNAELIMFYADYFFKDKFYYIEGLQTIAVAEHEEATLMLYDVLALSEVKIKDIINTLSEEQTEKTSLGFIPMDDQNYEVNLFKEEDTTLFVQSENASLFEGNKLLFPILSHT